MLCDVLRNDRRIVCSIAHCVLSPLSRDGGLMFYILSCNKTQAVRL